MDWFCWARRPPPPKCEPVRIFVVALSAGAASSCHPPAPRRARTPSAAKTYARKARTPRRPAPLIASRARLAVTWRQQRLKARGMALETGEEGRL